MTSFEERCIGLEQEFFLVDAAGALSGRADEFLKRCEELLEKAGRDPESFAPECARSMVEVNAPPVHSISELSREYLAGAGLAIEAARDLDLRVYPLATYPLAAENTLRDEPRYDLQARAVGRERFQIAGRCAGVHIHLEAKAGTIDSRVGVSYDSAKAARDGLLNLYNLATALDPAMISLSRSCPFYAGKATGVANRTACYRGDPELFPGGLYSKLPLMGGLPPYAATIEDLVEQQFARHYSWLDTMERAGMDPRLLAETGDGLLQTSWNPVRLNAVGTVELRGIDSNYPEMVLAIAALVKGAADRVRREDLRVVPQEGLRAFEAAGDTLYVPDFEYLSGELFREAATGGIQSSAVVSYLDSVLEFSRSNEDFGGFETLKTADGSYKSTETEILQKFPTISVLSEEEGLDLVREACDEFEEQVAELKRRETTGMTKAGANGD